MMGMSQTVHCAGTIPRWSRNNKRCWTRRGRNTSEISVLSSLVEPRYWNKFLKISGICPALLNSTIKETPGCNHTSHFNKPSAGLNAHESLIHQNRFLIFKWDKRSLTDISPMQELTYESMIHAVLEPDCDG